MEGGLDAESGGQNGGITEKPAYRISVVPVSGWDMNDHKCRRRCCAPLCMVIEFFVIC